MPGQQEVRWSQLKVGVLVLVAVCALISLVFLMSGASGGFWSGHLTVISYFENSAGLKNGAPVNLDGVTVGNVTAIHIDPSRPQTPVEVVMKLNERNARNIRSDSKSSLETVGVLGDTVVDIDSRNANGGPVQNGAILQTTETPNLQDVIQASQGTIEKLDTILDQVNRLANTLNSQNGSIGMLINNRQLYDKASRTLDELSSLVDQVSNGKGSLGKLVTDDTLYNNLNQATTNLNQIVGQVNSGKGSLGKLMKDESLYNNMNQSAKQLNDLLTNINAGKGSLGVLAKNPDFANKLSDTVSRLDSILTQIDQGQGTVGQLMKNRELYDHMNQLTSNANQLVTGIRTNPKKYLSGSIRVHIF